MIYLVFNLFHFSISVILTIQPACMLLLINSIPHIVMSTISQYIRCLYGVSRHTQIQNFCQRGPISGNDFMSWWGKRQRGFENSEYDQEIPQSQAAEKPMAP